MARTATADGEGLKVLYADDRRYAPVRVLGEGHTARVLLATDPGGAQVAIKAMKADCSLSPREFMQEADRLQALRRKERELFPDRTDAQSGFPSVIDRDPEERFFVMEVAPGRPLARLFSNRQIVRPEQAVSITVRVGEALQVAAALELRAQDLKSDAIFWDHVSGRVVIVDWNVVANTRSPETGWLPADLRTTASYLDALLAGGETVSEWSGRIYDPPTRWNRYYRALRLSLEDLVQHPEGATLDEFLSTLLAVEAMLSDRPENLLEFVRSCLVDAREVDDDTRIGLSEQAAAAAEIALATRSAAVSMDGRALMAQAEDLAGAEGPLIARLWNAVKTADEAGGFDVGKSLETYRLRTLASVARRAPGYAGEALEIARQFARLEWSLAAKGIAALRTQLAEHPAVSSLLQDLEHEAKGLRDGRLALEAIEADDAEKARGLLAGGLAELSKVRYHDKLMERFPMLREQFGSLPAPVARKTEVDQSELAIQAARRRFARQGRLHLESFEQYGEHAGVRALAELQGAWDETDQHSTETPPRAHLIIAPLLAAMDVSARERGCFPLNRAEKTFDRVIEDMDIRLSTVDREGADQIRNEADAIGDRCRSITDALRDTDLDRGWTTEAVDALKTWRRRFRERAERASEAHQTLSLYVRGLEKLGGEAGLAGRAELLTRLVRRRPEDATVKRLMGDLRAEVDDAEQSRPDDPDVIAARRVLDPNAPVVAGASMSQAVTTPNRVGGLSSGRPPRRPANDKGRRPPPQRRTTPPAKPVDRNRTLYIMGSAVLVVVILVASWALTRPPADPVAPQPDPGNAVNAGMGTDPGAADKTAAEKAAADQAAAEKAAAEKAAADQAAADQAAAEKAAAEKAAAEKAAADKAAADKAAADKAAAEKAAREKAAREKAARDRARNRDRNRDRARAGDKDDTPPRRRNRRTRKPSSDEAAQQAALERARKLREQLEKERSGGGTKPKPTPKPTPKPKPKPKDDGKAGGDKKDGGKPSYLTDDW